MIDFAEIKIQVAENVGYDDGVGGILSGKRLTEDMIGKYVNRRYMQLVRMLASKYPEDYIDTEYINFWSASGTIDTVLAKTVTTTTGIFTASMKGLTVYVDGENHKIAKIVAADEIELVTEPTWSSGTIYVLGGKYPINVSRNRYVVDVHAKYTDIYQPAQLRGAQSLGLNTTYSTGDPRWYRTNIGGVQAIGVLPEPTRPIEEGLRVDFINLPDPLDADSDIPNLPPDSADTLVAGATLDACRKIGKKDLIDEYKQEWVVGAGSMVGDYARARVKARKGRRAQYWYNLRERNV